MTTAIKTCLGGRAHVSYQVILINDQFPGPVINSTSNNNVVVNLFNNLDEPFLLTWSGIQQRKNSWQEGVLGTNCPISPGTNHTYHFQVKDQIGSFLYYPSTSIHKANGAFGGLHINSGLLIPVPYDAPEDDFTVIVKIDWSLEHRHLKRGSTTIFSTQLAGQQCKYFQNHGQQSS
ncbi:hypothetical protein MANES_07G060701v8 [Manihot esculenta]|uniref:Uncharacterized protein n=1 Tax=Manihot esculenta TaxID=3983 RepID=A0ACB7HDN5_MANES|nr:hypothetical protein MANES_07G060701v8 [Manihot esculenta]